MKNDAKLSNEQICSILIEWMYLQDGAFDSKNEWRQAFVKKLKNVLGLTEEDSIEDWG